MVEHLAYSVKNASDISWTETMMLHSKAPGSGTVCRRAWVLPMRFEREEGLLERMGQRRWHALR